jgi:hypothetical protein
VYNELHLLRANRRQEGLFGGRMAPRPEREHCINDAPVRGRYPAVRVSLVGLVRAPLGDRRLPQDAPAEQMGVQVYVWLAQSASHSDWPKIVTVTREPSGTKDPAGGLRLITSPAS